jgi:NADPH2:quinone reductase
METHRIAAHATRAGGPDVLDVVAEPLAPLEAGDVLVRVEAAGLNHVDSLVRSGGYAIRWPFPFAVGIEGAGTVVAAGPQAAIAEGARVCWTAVPGSCATYVSAPAHMLAILSDALSFEAGASLAHAGLTAAGLVRHCPLPAGATVVVWGAAGAVGLSLVAQLVDRGVTVIGIASGERVGAARAAGAQYVVDRLTEPVADAVRDCTHGRGAEAVFDPIGAEAYETNLRLLAPRGYLVNYGQLSGGLPPIDLGGVMDAGSIFVTKYGPRAGVIGIDQLAGCIATALAIAVKRPVAPCVAARFPLDRVREAYRMLDSNPSGKVLVLPH